MYLYPAEFGGLALGCRCEQVRRVLPDLGTLGVKAAERREGRELNLLCGLG